MIKPLKTLSCKIKRKENREAFQKIVAQSYDRLLPAIQTAKTFKSGSQVENENVSLLELPLNNFLPQLV